MGGQGVCLWMRVGFVTVMCVESNMGKMPPLLPVMCLMHSIKAPSTSATWKLGVWLIESADYADSQ